MKPMSTISPFLSAGKLLMRLAGIVILPWAVVLSLWRAGLAGVMIQHIWELHPRVSPCNSGWLEISYID